MREHPAQEDWGPDVGKTDLGQQLWEEDWENSNMSDPFAQVTPGRGQHLSDRVFNAGPGLPGARVGKDGTRARRSSGSIWSD